MPSGEDTTGQVFPCRSAGGDAHFGRTLSIHEILSLPYGAVVQIQVTVSGSTKTVGIYGTSGTNVYSDFTVEYVP